MMGLSDSTVQNTARQRVVYDEIMYLQQRHSPITAL